MTPLIKRFRCKDYGLFMDLGSGDTLAVDTASGDVLLSHGGVTTFIPPAECKGFELHKQSVLRHQVSIRQMDNVKQVVGYTLDPFQAKDWIENANLAIARNRPVPDANAVRTKTAPKTSVVHKAASRAKSKLVPKQIRQIHK